MLWYCSNIGMVACNETLLNGNLGLLVNSKSRLRCLAHFPRLDCMLRYAWLQRSFNAGLYWCIGAWWWHTFFTVTTSRVAIGHSLHYLRQLGLLQHLPKEWYIAKYDSLSLVNWLAWQVIWINLLSMCQLCDRLFKRYCQFCAALSDTNTARARGGD